MLPLTALFTYGDKNQKSKKLWIPIFLFWIILMPVLQFAFLILFGVDLSRKIRKKQKSFVCLSAFLLFFQNLSSVRGFILSVEDKHTKLNFKIR